MRAALAVPLLLLLPLVAGCLEPEAPGASLAPASASPPVDEEGFSPVLFSGVRFMEVDLGVQDGLRLHADVYLPDGPTSPDAPARVPAILLLSPYWGTGTGGRPIGYKPYDFLVERLLPRGYAVVFGDLAGNGGSSGCWDFMGPVERKGAVAMVEAIAQQAWSDGKVGMMGLSYDGMTQIMAASDQAPHLVTVVPAAPLTHAYAGLRTNGVHYGGGWHTTIAGYEASTLQPPVSTWPPGANPTRVPGWLETAQRTPACVADNHRGDATGAYTDYYQARDYRPLGANVTASVFYVQGFLDGAVKPDNHGAWFDAVPTLKKAWLGHWFHQYPTAKNGGREDLYLTLHRWFDHTLKGVDNGIDREPAVDVQDSQGRWRHEAAWPPADAAPATLWLAPDGLAGSPGDAPATASVGGPVALRDLTDRGPTAGLVFRMETTRALHLAGEPRLNLTVESDRPAGMLVARLWDETDGRLVSQGAFNLLYREGLEQPRPLARGERAHAGFALYPTDFVVPEGHTLALQLLTQDPRGWFDLDATGARLTVHVGDGSSFLTLPLVERGDADVFLVSCGEHLKSLVKDCWKDPKDAGVKADA